MNELNYETVVKEYFDALEKRDVARCMEFFADDAVLYFGPRTLGLGKFKGRDQLEQWHKDRFEANMRVNEIEEITVDDDSVTVKVTVGSDRLAAVNIDDFKGQATATFDGGKFKEVRLGLRRGYRFHI